MLFNNIMSHKFFLNFNKYKYLLYELIKRNIKLTYRRSILGIFWSFLSPLLYTLVLTLVFSTFFGRTIENYPVYVVIGKLTFDFFAKGTRSLMASIVSANTLKKVYVPKYIYPLSRAIGTYIMYWISLSVLLLMIIVTKVPFNFHMFLAIVPIILIFFLVLGIGLTLATINVFVRDMQHLWGVISTIFMWTSAIFYQADVVPLKLRFIVEYNPLYVVINMIRKTILNGQSFNLMEVAYVGGLAIFFIALGIVLLYKYQDKIMLYI